MAIEKKYDATGRELGTDQIISDVIGGYQVIGAIGPELMPPVEMPRQFGVFFTLGGRPRLETLARAPGAQPKQLGFVTTSTDYFNQGYNAMQLLPVEDFGTGVGNRLVVGAAKFLVNAMTVALEDRTATVIGTSTAVSTVYVVGSAWDAVANPGKAYQAVETALQYCEDQGGYRPNIVAFGKSAWRSFSTNSSVLAACGNWVTPGRVAEAYLLSKVLVAQNLRDASDEGLTLSPRAVFDDVVYAVRQPESPNASYEARHSAVAYWIPPGERTSAPGAFVAIQHPLDKKHHAVPVEVSAYRHPIIIDPKLGVAIKGVNSAQAGGLT
jgi:hypothetical protein